MRIGEKMGLKLRKMKPAKEKLPFVKFKSFFPLSISDT
jgi:hypothetical protein